MPCRQIESLASNSSKYFRGIHNNRRIIMHLRFLSYHQQFPEPEKSLQEDEILPSEWYENAFLKLKNRARMLKHVDLIDGKLVSINDNSRIFDGKLREEMLAFRSLFRDFIGCSAVQEAVRKNVLSTFDEFNESTLPVLFRRACERGPLALNSLTKVSNILNVTAQQRKVVRHKILPQVTQHQIWTGALVEILNDLRPEIHHQISSDCQTSKEIKMAQQIVASCLKFLKITISYDEESTSWMRLTPAKGVSAGDSHKWEDVLEMFIELIACLRDEREFTPHVAKLEVMKEGLYQIRDVLMDKNIGYRETRHHENLVQKKLIKSLGHSSRCLFTLLLYYLYGSIQDIEVEVSGGFYPMKVPNKFCLSMGKILASEEENVIWGGVKQLDRALGLFKFVWETAGMKGDLKLLGHLWCIGNENRCLTYKGTPYLLHGIN